MSERTTYGTISPRTGGFVGRRGRLMPKRQEERRSGRSRVKPTGVLRAKDTKPFSPDGRKGLASIKTAMSFGTTKKNPPPKPKKKKGGWLMGGKTGWDMLEQMEREAQGAPVPKSERRKKKGK